MMPRVMQAKFLFLGTGASAGVPIIGCSCAVCRSANPHNKRLRPSGLLRVGAKSILIDIGPDFRQQALQHKIGHLDGMLLTHTHYDHIAGIDELRVMNFRQKAPFPCLLSQESLDDLHVRYYYLFQPLSEKGSHAAKLDCHVLESSDGMTEFLGIRIGYVSYAQGGMKVTGFRLGNFAYISDIREYSPSIFDALQGVEVLVVSALRPEESPVHFSTVQAAEFAKCVGASQTFLTHLSHAIDADIALPQGVRLGFDGLEIPFEVSDG